ncbi:hypothetical protein DKX38_020312 [Salix brachista]|uniref:G domain-containing protein n=1 Tax=Salix brachista TaxID=2182728 RepID=A0A5N5KIT9_9ROSI|nr:hypothetical protein DKX38_020312 [Salix brachista]
MECLIYSCFFSLFVWKKGGFSSCLLRVMTHYDSFFSESTTEREKEMEEDAGMSKNAQFRAIQPSTSILSYVEDDFRGRRRLIELKRAGYDTDLSTPLDNIPFSTSSERERIEENVCFHFAIMSYVGKSSLLNSLTRQWGVARTSDKPGLTQLNNLFYLCRASRIADVNEVAESLEYT